MQEAVREEHVARMQQASDHLYQQVSPCQCRMWWSKSDFRPRGILWYIFNGYFSIGHSWPLFHFICSPFHSFVNKNYNFSFYFQPFSFFCKQKLHVFILFPALFIVFSFFRKQKLQFFNKWMWRNVHPVNTAGIRTHNLQKTSLLP